MGLFENFKCRREPRETAGKGGAGLHPFEERVPQKPHAKGPGKESNQQREGDSINNRLEMRIGAIVNRVSGIEGAVGI